MSILGRIGNRIGSDLRRLPGGNAVGNALGRSPVMGRLPGVRPPQGLGPSPNGLQNMAQAIPGAVGGGGDMGPQRLPDAPPMMGPVPEGPQNTGITGGMIPPQSEGGMMGAGGMMRNPQGPPRPAIGMGDQPQGQGMGPNPAALQQMMQRRQMNAQQMAQGGAMQNRQY